MVTSSAQSLPNSQARSQMDIVKNCPTSARKLPVHAVSQNQLRRTCSNGKLPDPQTVSEWLQNGSINRDKLQNVKERQLRKIIATTTTGAMQTIKQSFQDLEGPKSNPSKEPWPDNHSKIVLSQQRKLEDNEEENVLKEALQGLVIGLSSAVFFCSILFRFVLNNKV